MNAIAGSAETAEHSETLGASEQVSIGEVRRVAGDRMPRRDEVEPYLAALLQAEHLNLLVGSGLTTALAYGAKATATVDMSASLSTGVAELDEALEAAAAKVAGEAGRGAPNIEDRLRVALAAEEGLRFVGDARADQIMVAVAAGLGKLINEVAAVETAIGHGVETQVVGTVTLRALFSAFLGSFAGRTPTRDRLHVFTTNYDRVLEWGAELAGLRTIDRFVGSLEPIFRSSRLEIDYHFSPPGAVRDPRHLDGVFRLTKLHGSLDWVWDDATRRVRRTPFSFGDAQPTNASRMLIYPNAAKDVETASYPYVELFRDLSAAACRPQAAVVTYGYGFGDDHINRVLRDMLTVPSTHLLVISYDDPGGRISRFAEEHRRVGQVSLMLGPRFGGLVELVDRWLPWPSADALVRRTAGISRDRASTTGPGTSSNGS